MEKVLITGGYGFVGSQLLAELSSGYDITVLDNMLSGGIPFSNIKHIDVDIRDQNKIALLIPKFDTIIHLAAIVGEPACVIDPAFSYSVNVIGTRNILQVLSKDQRFIFTSTSSIYGNRPNEVVSELSTPIPINNYARQKYQSERDIQQWCNNYIIVRPVTAFGITRCTRIDLLVNTLIYTGLSTHEIEVYEPLVMRPIIHVKDFARVLHYALDGKLGVNEIYNIGDPTYNMNKLQLAAQIAILTESRIIQKDGESLDPRNYDVSFDKLIKTGFTFGPNRLYLAVEQIRAVLDDIQRNPESFSTPYKVRQFLAKEK